jgi:hypothetical protein
MDHLLARPGVVSATNKDSITISRCSALWEMVKFNSSSFAIAFLVGALGYVTVLQDQGWDFTKRLTTEEIVENAFFAGPAVFLMVLCFVVPVILNPYILGWPFVRRGKKPAAPKKQPSKRKLVKKDSLGREIVDFNTFMQDAAELQKEIERVEGKPDVELGSLGTKDLRSYGSPSFRTKKSLDSKGQQQARPPAGGQQQRMPRIPEARADQQQQRPHSQHGYTSSSDHRRQAVPDPKPGKPKRYNDHFPYTSYPSSSKSAV